MIKLSGFHLSQLPDRRELTTLLSQPFYQSWRERHRSIRDERASRISLAGILLLQLQGHSGKLIYDTNGRPSLDGGTIDFNLSHNYQSVFCAIETTDPDECTVLPPDAARPYPSREAPNGTQKMLFPGQPRVGIDTEDLQRLSTVRVCPMADRWFTSAEYDFFLTDPTDVTFLRIWTRKEALIKWTGEGLRSLRSADTVTAPSVYGIRFYEYWIDRTLLTLCCRQEATPPPSVYMYSNSELTAYKMLMK